jgi:zinc protease
MKRAFLFLALMLVAPAGMAPAAWADDKKAAPEYKVPHPVTKTLANGLVVHVFEDHALPAVYYRMLVKTGASNEAAEKAGLASLTCDVMRKGTATLNSQELAEKIDFLGADLEAAADRDYSTLIAQARTQDKDVILGLMADVALHPAFAQDEVDRAKSQTQAAIRQSRDDPATVADEHLAALIHGTHPYARPVSGDESSVGGLTRQDLVDFHAAYWRPNNAVLAIAGDVSAEETFAAVEKAFGSWEKKDVPPRPTSPSPDLRGNVVRLLDKPDLTQSQLRIGYVGVPRSTPDYYSLQLMNYVLGGGGFASRLTADVRTKMGLTYDISTAFTFGVDPGSFVIDTFTKNATVKQAIDATFAEVKGYRDQGPTPDELAKAKSYYLGAFPFLFESPGDVARQWLVAGFYGLGDDYFDKYRDRIRAVTADDVKRVAQKYLRTEPVALVVVGRADSVQSQLTSYGNVEKLDFTARSGAVPEVAPAVPLASVPATPESRDKAAAVVAKAVKAHGGLAALAAIKDWHTKGSLWLNVGSANLDGQYSETVQLPSRRRMEMAIMGQNMVQVLDGDSAWASASGRLVPVSKDQLEAMRQGTYTNPVRLLTTLSEPKADIRYAGTDTAFGKTADVVEWNRPGGRPARVYIDSASGLLVLIEQPELSPLGSGWVPVRRVYTDYKTVGKVKFPYTVTVYANGEKAVQQSLAEVQWNAGAPVALFRRPPGQ